MNISKKVEDAAEEVVAALRSVHRIRASALDEALAKAGRLLPSRIKQSAAYLVEAQFKLGHPRLEQMIDPKQVKRARKAILDHLGHVDVADLRRGQRLGIAGGIAFNIFVVALAFLGWLAFWAPDIPQ